MNKKEYDILLEPKCHIRKCNHFIGVSQPDDTEMTERVICKAYPNMIPADIAYGGDLHNTIRPDQQNSIIFEKKKTTNKN